MTVGSIINWRFGQVLTEIIVAVSLLVIRFPLTSPYVGRKLVYPGSNGTGSAREWTRI